MTTEGPQASPTIPRGQRWLLALGAAALTALIGMAVWLTPDEHGLGTHQQLGLPPCSFRMLFDRPCPTCGMTTAWACLVRGQFAGACRANAGGALLGLWAGLSVPWMLSTALWGRWPCGQPTGNAAAWTLIAIAAITLVHWAARMAACL